MIEPYRRTLIEDLALCMSAVSDIVRTFLLWMMTDGVE